MLRPLQGQIFPPRRSQGGLDYFRCLAVSLTFLQTGAKVPGKTVLQRLQKRTGKISGSVAICFCSNRIGRLIFQQGRGKSLHGFVQGNLREQDSAVLDDCHQRWQYVHSVPLRRPHFFHRESRDRSRLGWETSRSIQLWFRTCQFILFHSGQRHQWPSDEIAQPSQT